MPAEASAIFWKNVPSSSCCPLICGRAKGCEEPRAAQEAVVAVTWRSSWPTAGRLISRRAWIGFPVWFGRGSPRKLFN